MKVIIAGYDRLGIVMAGILSEANNDVLIVDEHGSRLRALPSELVARENVDLLEADPKLDETMVAMDIRNTNMFIAAMRTPSENGLIALKSKLIYGVENVIAIINNEALASIHRKFDIQTVNPYTLVLSNLRDALEIDDAQTGESINTLSSNPGE